MLTFIREITCSVACLGLVLSCLVINDSVWVRFVSYRRESSMPPGMRPLMFPSFNQVVAQEPYQIDFTAFQSSLIGSLSCYFVAFAVKSRALCFFVWASESTLDNRARSNHGTERRFWFLWCMTYAPRAHVALHHSGGLHSELFQIV